MMFAGIRTVFGKELLDTIRDRKTFTFMLLVPTILTPALIIGIVTIALEILKQNALEEVVIAADQKTHDRYREMVHAQFLRSDIGKALRLARSPVAAFFLSKGPLNEMLKGIPPKAIKDPVAYEEWAHSLADEARKSLEGEVQIKGAYDQISEFSETRRPAEQELLETVSNTVYDFYLLSVRGLGLLRFVDPTTLPDPTPADMKADLPPQLAKHPEAFRIYAAIQSKQIHGYLEIDTSMTNLENRHDVSSGLTLFYDSTIPLSQEAHDRVQEVVNSAARGIVDARTLSAGLPKTFLNPIVVTRGTNVASRSQITAAAIGGMLPYLVLTFAFLGGVYPAVDLGAGEKERNTLETLLLSPITRTEIALGKFSLIFLTSLLAALLGITSLVLTFHFFVPKEIIRQLEFRIDLFTGLSVALLAIPPAAAFAGIFLAISIFARSFKEAQNYLSPLGFVMILPGMAGLIPGVEMSWKMALIPIVNVSLLSKDFLKGDINWGYYALTFGSCAAIAALCLAYCVYQFRREEVLFRT